MNSCSLHWADWIDTDEILDKLSRLVAIPSVVEDGHPEEGVVQEILQWCRDDGFDPVLTMVSAHRHNLLLEIRGDRPGPKLLLEAHSDTVTAGDVSLWTYPPFQATRCEDRLYGRGTADTKGNLVAAYLAVCILQQATGGIFPGSVQFLVPVDEEGMMSGIRHYIASDYARGLDGAICCEPEDLMVCVRQKGALRLEAEFFGWMAHGAMPLTGVNPIPIMAQFLQALAEEEALAQDAMGYDRYLGWPSMTPTQIKAPIVGPQGFNVMPASAAVSIDVRTVPGQSHNLLVERLQQRLSGIVKAANNDLTDGRAHYLRSVLEQATNHRLITGRLNLIDDRPVTETWPDHPLVQAAAAAVKSVTGRDPVYGGVPGATDGTWLWAAGIPIVTIGAGNRFVPHQVDEWVSLQQLTDTVGIYADTAYRFLHHL